MNTNSPSEEFDNLAKLIDDELEARVINDELEAVVINDEVDAYAIKEQMSNTPTEEASEQVSLMQERMAKYLSSIANHQPGKQFTFGQQTFTVQGEPHRGVWTRDNPIVVSNPNYKNKSVRNKLQRHPKKYTVVNN